MPTLRKTRAKDAQGKPVEPDRRYTPITSHGRVVNGAPRVYNPGNELRGGHEGRPHRAKALDRGGATTEGKDAARKANYDAAMSSLPPQPPNAQQPFRIAEPRKIPQARRWIATDEFWLGSEFVGRGSAHDVDDAVVKRAPQYF